ncbi:ArnT family glycosyltransferase [Verrucomicrobiota bacterium sgz303538]
MNPEPSTRWTSPVQRRVAVALAVAFAALALWLFTRHNDFAFFYHSDESAKVEQVLTKAYNFHHPMLMLTGTELWLGRSSGALDEQRTVEAGRLVSATFAAVAVGAFALLAFLRAGWLAAIATGLLLAFNQQLFELAHYMKEDPALLVGIALTFLALAWYQQRQSWFVALSCGAACGVAISGKYIGVLALICAAPVLLTAGKIPRKQRALHAAISIAGALVVLILTNLPLLRDLATFKASFDREMGMVVSGSKGMTRRIPHAVYLSVFADNTTPVIWLLLVAYYVRFWQRRREQDALAWVIALFPLLLTVLFSFSPKTNDRYYLPVTVTFYYLAALSLADIATNGFARWRPASHRQSVLVGTALLVVALAVEAPKFLDVFRAFQHDDRRELADFIQAKLPADAQIAQDSRVMLPDKRNRKRNRVVADLSQTIVSGDRYASEVGNLDQLKAAGITYVAVTESNYGRFYVESLTAKDEYREEFAQHRGFYDRLFREGALLFERPRGTVIYLHPGLRLYRISSSAPQRRS